MQALLLRGGSNLTAIGDDPLPCAWFMLQELAATSVKKDRESGQNALALLSHFAKGAREHLMGLPPVLPVLQIPTELLKV